MNRTKRILGACGLFLTFAAATPVHADIARPSNPEKPRVVMHTSMVVTTDSKAYDARLQISKESLNELRAALGDIPANSSAAQSGGSISQRLTGSSTRTLMAGVMMFLSLSLGGIWLARSVQTRSQKTVAAFLLCTAMIGAAAIITQANAGPPPSWQWRKLSNNLTQGRPTYASVNIEIVEEPGHGIKLIVPVTPNAKTKDD
ncbi:MAG TPA: hypothetical protein VNO50_06940 [Pyrinomonadaceae bacterium]|nr:hypothetical protein [Pyrinomonadaceae bacterium]